MLPILKAYQDSPIYYKFETEFDAATTTRKKEDGEKSFAHLSLYMMNEDNDAVKEKVADFISTGGCLTQVVKLDERKFSLFTTVCHEEIEPPYNTKAVEGWITAPSDKYRGIIAWGHRENEGSFSIINYNTAVVAVFEPDNPDKYYLACVITVKPDGTIGAKTYGKLVDFNKFGNKIQK